MSKQAESSKDEKNAQAASEQEVRSGLALTVKQEKVLGWVATFMAVCMYVAYVPQIVSNLNGQAGNPLQPLVAAINCSLRGTTACSSLLVTCRWQPLTPPAFSSA